MEIKAKEIKMVPIDEIVPNDKNNNIHTDEQKRYAKKIFEVNGFRMPLVVSNRSGKLIAGHLRLEVAKELGAKELPVIFQDFNSEEEEFQHLTADNALARQASLDYALINTQVQELDPFDIELLGIADFVIDLNEFELDEDKEKDKENIFKIEVYFSNETDKNAVYQNLLSQGYIVKDR